MPAHTAHATNETWTDWTVDLADHRRAYRGASYRWDPDTVVETIDWYTAGLRDFATLADLTILDQARTGLHELRAATRLALAGPLTAAADVAGWEQASRAVCLARNTARRIIRDAEREPLARRTSSLADHATEGLGTNPLILAWEIRQAWELASAAYHVVSDTTTTLLWELRQAGASTAQLADHAPGLTDAQIRARLRKREYEALKFPPGSYDFARPASIPQQRL